jgi:hypothetical protein
MKKERGFNKLSRDCEDFERLFTALYEVHVAACPMMATRNMGSKTTNFVQAI